MDEVLAYEQRGNRNFQLVFMLSAMLAFFINMSQIWCTKVTSSSSSSTSPLSLSLSLSLSLCVRARACVYVCVRDPNCVAVVRVCMNRSTRL